MNNTPIYPHVKVFVDTDNEIHLLTYTYPDKYGHKHDGYIGLGLIDFITLDLTEFEDKLKKAYAETMLAYDDMRNLIYDIAELLKDKHSYVYFFLVGKLNRVFEEESIAEMQFECCFDELFSVLELYEIFSFGVNVCLDAENLPKYSIPEKFIAFVTKYDRYKDFALKTSVRVTPTYKGKVDYGIVKDINSKNISDTKMLLQAIHRGQKGVSIASFTFIESLEEMLYLEFIELLKQGLQVKKCKLCDKYFVLTSKHETEFCDRIYKGRRTCRQVGVKKSYNERVVASPVLKEYQRIYKRYFARGDMPFQKNPQSKFYDMTFREWAKMATGMRKKYLSGAISESELFERIVE